MTANLQSHSRCSSRSSSASLASLCVHDRILCFRDELEDAPGSADVTLDPALLRRVVNATEQASHIASGPTTLEAGGLVLMPDTNDGGFPQLIAAMDTSRRKAMPQSAAVPIQDTRADLQSGEPALQGLGRSGRRRSRARNQPKWDMFPGIELSSGSRRPSLSKPSVGSFTGPLKRLVTSFRRSRSLSLKSLRSRQPDQDSLEEAAPSGDQEGYSGNVLSRSLEEEYKGGIVYPADSSGSVDRSDEFADMENKLTKTFGHDKYPLQGIKERKSQDSNKDRLTPQGSSQLDMQRSSDLSSHDMKWRRSRSFSEGKRDPQSQPKETGTLNMATFKGVMFLNDYAIVRTLGKGSFGTVKLALNTKDFELRALKLLPKTGQEQGMPISDPDVLREIAVMKKLDHPNIVRLYEVIDDPLNSKILLVMEHAAGGALFSGSRMTPKQRLSELMARSYFREILSGMDYLHANKIAHGDLKPSNLLLHANGRVKIADFGSSQLTRRGEVVRRTAGTPAFMAPELCTGEPYHARLADVWSLGVCLYMFVFGTLPFKAASVYQLYESIQNDKLSFPTDCFISDSLKHLLMRLLEKSPDTRITLVGAMCHPWVTHNNAQPLPNLQSLENDEELDSKQMLMECWPFNTTEGNKSTLYQFVSPTYEMRAYEDGALLAKKGDKPDFAFYINEGQVTIYQTRSRTGKLIYDTEDEEESKKLQQDGTMLKTMLDASVTASEYASAVRQVSDCGSTTIVATRGVGTLVGEIAHYEGTAADAWQADVRAKGRVVMSLVSYPELSVLRAKRPEVEADIRAIQAQKQSELMLMAMLERLASLRQDLERIALSAQQEQTSG